MGLKLPFFTPKFVSCICWEMHAETGSVQSGVLSPHTNCLFFKNDASPIELSGSAVIVENPQPVWNFENLGIGGLDEEFSTIFRRAFASRVLPIETIEQLEIKHVRGILLYGPPGRRVTN